MVERQPSKLNVASSTLVSRSSYCRYSSGVERFLGKEKVPSSNLGIGSSLNKQLMLIDVLKSKIHRIKVTDGNLDYIGSLTLDLDLMDKVGLVNGEKIQVLNVNNGERLETYVIEGQRGKGEVIVNGPATYKISKGDKIIINSYAKIEFKLASRFKPKLLIYD